MADGATLFREAKRQRTTTAVETIHAEETVRRLLTGKQTVPVGKIKIRNDINIAREFLDAHGFRTAIVKSPRLGLSIYKDSCVLPHPSTDETKVAAKEFLCTMLGLHPRQNDLEAYYLEAIHYPYSALLFCDRIRQVCRHDKDPDGELMAALQRCQDTCQTLGGTRVASVWNLVKVLMQRVVQSDPSIRVEQLQHELDRILFLNSTLANAYLQLWLKENNTSVQEVVYKRNLLERLERFTLYLYDASLDASKPPPFSWMPCLSQAVLSGPDAVAKNMTATFWAELLRQGYFASESMKSNLSWEMDKYFLGGITKDDSGPLRLTAHFVPTYPLSFYIHGKAGVGKSSWTRLFSYAMNRAIQQFADPQILTRFVKQNLNKAYKVLELELDLRPNNNNLSAMSIIEGRRMTMTQTKPGLVTVGLEEMPSNRHGSDPSQLQTSQLIAQRFSGFKGVYRVGKFSHHKDRKGISDDASIIPIFTSNYPLEKASHEALSPLRMFSNLTVFNMKSVHGADRKCFAIAYLRQALQDSHPELDLTTSEIQVDLAWHEGDMRPLVKTLRMVIFYIRHFFEAACLSFLLLSVVQMDTTVHLMVDQQHVDLHVTPSNNLVLQPFHTFDGRTRLILDDLGPHTIMSIADVSLVIDLWLTRSLKPAVLVSKERERISSLSAALQRLQDVHSITDVDVSRTKMMKSLYDPQDTPNLRDQISKFGPGAHVVVELLCDSLDSQMRIREMIEDTPSMSAFSTENSALRKSGLFFLVAVKGDISPEIYSRASLVV